MGELGSSSDAISAPGDANARPVADDRRPVADDRRPVADDRRPVADDPDVSARRSHPLELVPAPSEAIEPPLAADSDDVHMLAALSVPAGARVLDVGCGSGRLGCLLTERDCLVVGVDKDPYALEAAASAYRQVVFGDLETDLEAPSLAGLGDSVGFDVVCLLDVLEHVRNPVEVLRWASGMLHTGGLVLVSLPNVTHAAVRLQLMTGRFSYTTDGLLDSSHVRFYDREAAEALLGMAGLAVVDRMRVRRRLDETEIHVRPDNFAAEVVAAATEDADALTYQFLFVAAHAPYAGAVPLSGHLQARLERFQDALQEASEYVRHLEDELSPVSQRIAELEVQIGQVTSDRDGIRQALAEAASYARHLEEELAAHVEWAAASESSDRTAAELDEVQQVLAEASDYARRLERELAAKDHHGRELEGTLAERMVELTDRSGEVRALQSDLTMKEAYVERIREDLTRSRDEVAAAGRHVAHVEAEYQRVLEHARVADLLQVRVAELSAELAATRDRAGFRLMERVHGALGFAPGLQPAARWLARRVVGRHPGRL